MLTTPADFARLFPGTGGALYGRATHGWRASFQRPGARTRIPGLYLAGGSTHPGPGVPMAALSGRLAAASVLADLCFDAPSRAAATPGGTSMRSPTTAQHGLTLIAFIGSVFSPYYARARRRGAADPLQHCAVNVALYGPRGKRWAMTERGRAAVARTPSSLAIGRSALRLGRRDADGRRSTK